MGSTHSTWSERATSEAPRAWGRRRRARAGRETTLPSLAPLKCKKNEHGHKTVFGMNPLRALPRGGFPGRLFSSTAIFVLLLEEPNDFSARQKLNFTTAFTPVCTTGFTTSSCFVFLLVYYFTTPQNWFWRKREKIPASQRGVPDPAPDMEAEWIHVFFLMCFKFCS